MSRTPNFTIMSPVNFSHVSGNLTLEPGDFVRPIALCYVSQHVIDDKRWRWFDPQNDVFCYTHYGVIPIPKRNLRET